MSPLLSVIVPVYKVEPYLRKALDGLLAQTYSKLEIICVDDGSPDACPAILDEYAAKDSRISVIHQRNQGLAAARNSGMELARGEYVAFMDSDDFILPQAYEKALAHMTDEIDMVQFGVRVLPAHAAVEQRTLRLQADYDLYMQNLLRVQDGEKGLSCDARAALGTSVSVWDKIFRRSLIERYHLRFPQGAWYEDAPFVQSYLAVSRRMYAVDEMLYEYVIRGGASLSALQGERNPGAMGMMACVDMSYQFYARHGIWERLILLLPELLYRLDVFKGLLPDEMQAEGEQRVRDIKRQWRQAVNDACPWDDRLQHLLGMHGWASLRHEWRYGRCCPKDRRRIFPGLTVFERRGLRKFFVCGVPVFTVVDVGGRRFFKLFGVKLRKKRIGD